MNEPKQMTEEEAIEEYCADFPCNGGDEKVIRRCKNNYRCDDLNNFIEFGKKHNWIKPDPTPEEKFWKEFCNNFDFGNNKSIIDWLKISIETLAAEIRAERKDK